MEMLNSQGEPIELLCYIYTRPNLRCDQGEMLMYVGRSHLANMFDDKQVDEKTTEIHLEYPERWANIPELRQIYKRAVRYYPNLRKLTIKTHSVYVIQCTENGSCRIMDDASQYPEHGEQLCPTSVDPGLMVFGGGVTYKR